MADNIYNNPNNKNTNNKPRMNSNSGDFKVNINFDDDSIFLDQSFRTGQKTSSTSKNDFSVNLPNNVNRNTRPNTNTVRKPASQVTTQRTVKPGQSTASSTAKKRTTTKAPTREKVVKKPKKEVTLEEYFLNKQKKKDSFIKKSITIIVCVVFIAIFTIALSTIAIQTLDDILVLGNDKADTVSIVIDAKNSKFDDVFDALSDAGLVKQKTLVKLFCKFRKYDKVNYEAGVYYFETNDGVESMLEEIMVSSSGTKNVINLTFPEGWSIAKIFAKIDKYKVCSSEKLYANLDIVAQQFDFYKKIDSKTGRYLMAEGYCFPDTYQFFIGESASSVLKKLFSNFEKHWEAEFTTKANALGLNMDQVLTIASIIQREAGNKDQMSVISSVLHNRLKNSSMYPNIQCDSTRDYITALNELGIFDSEYNYQLYSEAYNTYSTTGLPPGPICNPGLDAIKAALNPDSTSYYFFAHDANGQIYLASTADEHYLNKNKILSSAD